MRTTFAAAIVSGTIVSGTIVSGTIVAGTIVAGTIVAAGVAHAAVDFDRDVHPILAARCFACHSGDKRSGGLSLSNYSEALHGGKTGKVVNPGSSKDSLIMQRVQGQ